jgi:hypothetical protein
MATNTAVATLQAASDCRWSRPGYRVAGVVEQFQPETRWVCTRTGERRCIDAIECEQCPYWESADRRPEPHH